jgi:hypothetical protein
MAPCPESEEGPLVQRVEAASENCIGGTLESEIVLLLACES